MRTTATVRRSATGMSCTNAATATPAAINASEVRIQAGKVRFVGQAESGIRFVADVEHPSGPSPTPVRLLPGRCPDHQRG